MDEATKELRDMAIDFLLNYSPFDYTDLENMSDKELDELVWTYGKPFLYD